MTFQSPNFTLRSLPCRSVLLTMERQVQIMPLYVESGTCNPFFYKQVLITENPKSFSHFLNNICAIIGGVFTEAGILDSILHNTMRLIKKVELGKNCSRKCSWYAGKDATDDFEDVGHNSTARAMMDEMYVGDIGTATIPTKVKYTPPKQPQYNHDKTPKFSIKILQFLVPILILSFSFAMRFYTKQSAE